MIQIEPALFQAAQRQLNENRTRARMGTRRPGYLLQGLVICSECRYSYYGKTTRQRGAGALKDFTYYRCSGTDGYRFGGERICNNPQIRGEFIEGAVWTEVCNLLKNPQQLLQQHEQRLEIVRSPENLDALKSHLGKLRRGVERLIDSYSEGAIDKEQFMSRLSRTKARTAELEARIRSNTEGADHGRELRFLVDHFRKLADHLGRVHCEILGDLWTVAEFDQKILIVRIAGLQERHSSVSSDRQLIFHTAADIKNDPNAQCHIL